MREIVAEGARLRLSDFAGLMVDDHLVELAVFRPTEGWSLRIDQQ